MPHGSLSYPSPSPFRLSGNPMPSSGVSKMMKVAVLAERSWASSLSSITISATQPLGRHRTKPARPTSALSSLRPRPDGSSTPSGATTRISLLFWSAVLSMITVRPALERSSATTLWIRAHCSACAPGGVSQRICQSPCTERTAPWALAAAVRPKNSAVARLPAHKRLGPRPFLNLFSDQFLGLNGLIRVDPSGYIAPNAALIGNDGSLKAIFKYVLHVSLHVSLRAARAAPSRESGSCGAPRLCVHRAIRLSSAARMQKQ